MPPTHPRRNDTYTSDHESPALILAVLLLGAVGLAWYVASEHLHLTHAQIAELSLYTLLLLTAATLAVLLPLTSRQRRERQWPHSPLVMAPDRIRGEMQSAWDQNAIVLGHDIHGKPWLWPDRIRVMQAILLGMTGSGKTTLLKNIVIQDLYRTVGQLEDPRRIPMIILDGKGDQEFFHDLLPHIHRAGRLHQLRLLNPARPEFSVRYNPFFTNDDNYMAQVNMIFGSFNLHDEFFSKHQLNYLADIVRVLFYTGCRFNFYDVIVTALDTEVLKEQVEKATKKIERDSSITAQRKLNFQMSVKNLYQSFEDRERVPKIQGLLNECMTFLDDELSLVTGPYEDLLSIDEVIQDELILFVSLNINKNTEPVRALGKMLLQNLQLVIGKRYESQPNPERPSRPVISVVLDEFAPFGYRNFPQIVQTARGTNTAFLFSMQSLPQLMSVGRGFKEDVSSAPNTTLCMRTRDEISAQYFIKASSQQRAVRRTLGVQRRKLLSWEQYSETGSGSFTELKETRALDEHIKNLPKGQMEVLMSDDTQGTLHGLLHVVPPPTVNFPGHEPCLPKRVASSRDGTRGACLRLKDAKLARGLRLPRTVRGA
ncbi:MAG: type IV secretory system conjugative DNA transfer family protein [Acidobacteria bacterium]|nr:type IV secretory system conjugative DNA transfer family protein [Acidobacteriota bacterium]